MHHTCFRTGPDQIIIIRKVTKLKLFLESKSSEPTWISDTTFWHQESLRSCWVIKNNDFTAKMCAKKIILKAYRQKLQRWNSKDGPHLYIPSVQPINFNIIAIRKHMTASLQYSCYSISQHHQTTKKTYTDFKSNPGDMIKGLSVTRSFK
jgi:hypothetical protein